MGPSETNAGVDIVLETGDFSRWAPKNEDEDPFVISYLQIIHHIETVSLSA